MFSPPGLRYNNLFRAICESRAVWPDLLMGDIPVLTGVVQTKGVAPRGADQREVACRDGRDLLAGLGENHQGLQVELLLLN